MSTNASTSDDTKTKAASEPEVKRNDPTKWNIMIYIAGDSQLSAPMVSQLKQITDAGFQRDTRVLVFFDPNCNGRGARTFNVNARRKKYKKKKYNMPTIIGDGKDPYVRNIAEDCHVAGLPQIPAALSLLYFLERTRHQYPAENYMVFLLGHGVIVGNDAFLPNEDDDSAITLSQLSWILNKFATNVRKENAEFHLVGFHSCSMSSVELAYELKGTARYMIGTQGAAFPGSWPYRQVLKKIFNVLERPYDEARKKAKEKRKAEKIDETQFVDEKSKRDYLEKIYEGFLTEELRKPTSIEEILTGIQDLSFYNSVDFWFAGYSADLSLCSLDKDKVERLNEPLTNLSRALKAGLKDPATKKAILMAHAESQSYWGEAYSDLYDLCDRLHTYCEDTPKGSDIATACRLLMIEVLTTKPRNENFRIFGDFDRLVVYSDYYGPLYQFSHGLSIYFPWTLPQTQVSATYQNYSFTKDWGTDSWWSFLQDYFNETRRPLPDGRQLSPDEVEPMAGPPDKPPASGLEGLTDEQIFNWVTGPPDKSPAVGRPPQSPAVGSQPLLAPPDKSPAVGPPDKAPASGLFGATVIKNFTSPKKIVVTSRPWSRHGQPGPEEETEKGT